MAMMLPGAVRGWAGRQTKTSGAGHNADADADEKRVSKPSLESKTHRRRVDMFAEKGGVETSSWMAYCDEDTPMSGLTIPGTHDSAAYTYSFPFVATQKLKIHEQLGAGIRYLDFRCGVRDNIVEMVHGPTYLGLTLESLLRTIYDWLGKHPTEALVIQIKQDRQSETSTVPFDYAIFDLLVRDSEFWRTSNTLCSLGELRGRIQLFRRFSGPEHTLTAFGVDVTKWSDNPPSPFTIIAENRVRITVQDHYNFPSGTGLPALIQEKGSNVRELLQWANNNPDLNHWYINFVSAYELDLWYQVNPHQVAVGSYWGFHWEEGMNLRLRSFLHEGNQNRRRFGIIAMDFPEQGADDLVEALILTNFHRRNTSYGLRLCLWLGLAMLTLLLLWQCMFWWLLSLVDDAPSVIFVELE